MDACAARTDERGLRVKKQAMKTICLTRLEFLLLGAVVLGGNYGLEEIVAVLG